MGKTWIHLKPCIRDEAIKQNVAFLWPVYLFIYLFQPLLPVRAEVDAKLGGTQCNLIVSRLMPWMRLRLSNKKRMALGKENSHLEKSQTRDIKPVMWTCTVSAPEMTIVLYSPNGSALYHVSSHCCEEVFELLVVEFPFPLCARLKILC